MTTRSKPVSALQRLTDATPPDRDRAVDVARLAALIVVMFGHCALLLATIDASGVRINNLLGAVPALQPVTWIVQVMPLFFLAGGAAGAYGWHPDIQPGTPWGAWLLTRAQRLCRPVFWYLAAWSAALVVTRIVVGGQAADRIGREAVALLWFLGVYLVVLAFVPALTRLGSFRAAAALIAALLASAAGVDVLRWAVGDPLAGLPNFVIVWLIPVVIGVAYARRLLSRRAALIGAAGALAAQAALVVIGPYPVALVVTGTDEMSNVSPPTLLLALHCTWMSLAFVAAAPAIGRWAQRPRVWYAVAVGNGGAMTLYLWHIPAIAVAALALHAAGLDAYDVAAGAFWWLLGLRAVVFAVVMAVTFRLLSPLEHWPLPWWDAPVRATGARSAIAGALIVVAGVALLLLAKNGLAGISGWATLAWFLTTALAARATAPASAAAEPPAATRTTGPAARQPTAS